MSNLQPQSQFPKLKEFSKKFAITDKTIFAYDNVIYCNGKLPDDLIIHEETHHKQQERDGLDYWTENYLNDPKYRLSQEIEAYQNQLRSIKDKNKQLQIRLESARNISSQLYGGIIDYKQALEILK
jgi:hypothetical protein